MSIENKLNPAEEKPLLTIGLIGFGVVGQGLYEVLNNTKSLPARIKKICIKNADKKRSIEASFFTTDADILLNDPEINIVVELIDDAAAAFEFVKKALENGKQVVTANKKMVAEHFTELIELQQQYGQALLYEAACCASIPIIRNLEEYYDNDMLSSIKAIVNGSTNYILTKIFEEGLSFSEALLLARQAGFAEADPRLDVEGHDAANKLSILLAHAFGACVPPQEILYTGITQIKKQDAQLAAEKNCEIKLIATACKIDGDKLAAFILPQFINKKEELAQVKNEFNGIITESCFADKHFFKGKGAGAYPTAAAVLSDISALRYQYKYEYRKLQQPNGLHYSNDFYLRVYVSAPEVNLIPQEEFESIEEWHNGYNQHWAIGTIHAKKLLENKWWQQDQVSLILCENAIIENIEYKKLSKKSLALAGVIS